MMGSGEKAAARLARAAIWRGIGLLVLWLAVAGAEPADLPVGIVAAAAALWVSLVLLPPAAHPIRLAPLIRLAAGLLWQSVVAGADIAFRAFGPRLRLDPGFVRYRPGIPRGPARTTFGTLMSLVPGTLPAGLEPDGTLIVHCLDVAQPVAASMAKEEALLRQVLGWMASDA
jgi:multicomponent Na+:H+ antiporter subunit E